MATQNNQELARIFEEMALLYEVKEDKFRQRAYHRGADTLSTLQEDVKDILDNGGQAVLEELPGIGSGLAEKIIEYLKTRHIKEHEKLKKSLPINLEELVSVEGLGPKTAALLYKKLKIKNLKDLENAARAGEIRKIKGLGKRTEENILQGIEFVKSGGGRLLLGDVLPYARELIKKIKNLEGIEKISEAGSLRRRRETIGDVDILVAAQNNKKILDYVAELPDVVKVWDRGPTKLSVHTRGGFDIDVRAIKKESWGAALQYFTGNKAHNIHLRKIAISKKYKLNEYGLFRGKKNEVAGQDEESIYKKLGMEWMPPEVRTDTGEIEAAQNRKLPKLIGYGDIRGDLQIQTDWTDGAHSTEEMAKEAKKLGLEYIAITDHTKSLGVTGGSDEKRLLKQIKEIERVNKKIKGITVLSGAEVNILKDGTLDIKDAVLKKLDVVGVSVHSNFNMSKRDMTNRIMRAMRNPHADILFHPTGRLINRRAPYELDMEAIIHEAKNTSTILEINSYPSRLDLKDEYIRMAVRAGVKLCIDTDAHSKEHLKYMEYGIAQARRGWAEKEDIVNTKPLEQFLKNLKSGKK